MLKTNPGNRTAYNGSLISYNTVQEASGLLATKSQHETVYFPFTGEVTILETHVYKQDILNFSSMLTKFDFFPDA